MVTIKNIAKAANVSVTTVSYSLNNDSRIPIETRERVMAVAEELGYKGRSGKKSSNQNKHIVLCVNSIDGVIYSEIIAAIREVVKSSVCEFFIYIGKDIADIKWMDGLFVLNSKVDTEAIKEVAKRKIPIVVMDRNEKIKGTSSVALNNFAGCKAVTEHMISLGAKKMIFVAGPADSLESEERQNGYIKAVKENEHIVKDLGQFQGDFTESSGKRVAKFLMHTNLPDAVVCANDEMALGFVKALKSLKIDKDIKVAGFDGNAQIFYPGYVTAAANRKEWGTSAAFVMLGLFKDPNNNQDILIPVKLKTCD